MGEATNGKGRLAKLASRALIVLGGAVTVTAAGWLISSATASADTLPPSSVPVSQVSVSHDMSHDVSTPAGPLSGPMDVLRGSVGGTLGGTAAAKPLSLPLITPATLTKPVTLVTPATVDGWRGWPASWNNGWNQVTGSLRSAVTQLGQATWDRAAAVRLPNPLTSLATGSPASAVSHVGHPDTPAPAAMPSVHPAPLARPALSRLGGGTPYSSHHAAGPRPVSTTPGAPRAPSHTPRFPCGAPASGTSGSAGGSSGAGGLAGVGERSSYPMLPGVRRIGVSAPNEPARRMTAGRQPGVTPD